MNGSEKVISRKELAAIISKNRGREISTDQVRKNEKAWGLDLARDDFNLRQSGYKLKEAIEILKKAGILVGQVATAAT